MKKWSILLIVWTCFIFVVTSVPRLPSKFEVSWLSIVSHFGFYLVWAMLGVRLWDKSTLLYGIGLAVFDEWHQRFIPGRMCDWRDLIADIVGIAIGMAIMLQWLRYQRNKRSNPYGCRTKS